VRVIEVSDGIEVPTELSDFVNIVRAKEHLSHWPVHVWSCVGEGLCDWAIRFGLCKTIMRTKLLFLHEVAHAMLNPKQSSHAEDWHSDSYYHGDAWLKNFGRLCYTYLQDSTPYHKKEEAKSESST